MSARSPFRKTQTNIKKQINYNEALQLNWEDAMDKNFELMARVVEQKQKAKDENIKLRFYMTESLDEMDQLAKERDKIAIDMDKLSTHNHILGLLNHSLFKGYIIVSSWINYYEDFHS